jgi:hypothetical protein
MIDMNVKKLESFQMVYVVIHFKHKILTFFKLHKNMMIKKCVNAISTL